MKSILKRLNRKRVYAVKKLRVVFKYALPIAFINLLRKKKPTPSFENIKKILIVRNDLIGDMVITSGLLRNLAQHGYEIHVASKIQSLSIIKNNPYIKNIYSYNDVSFVQYLTTIFQTRKQHFDIVIDMKLSSTSHSMVYCSLLRTPILVGFNKSNVHSYNVSIPYRNPNQHITCSFEPLYTLLNVKADDGHYDVIVTPEVIERTQAWLQQRSIQFAPLNKNLLIFNPYGSKLERHLSLHQIATLLDDWSDYVVIIIGEYQKISKIPTRPNVHIFQSQSINEVMGLLQQAAYVVSVDTAIVHIACALKTPIVAIYKETPLLKKTHLSADDQLKIFKREYILLIQNKPYIQQHRFPVSKHIQSNLYAPQHTHSVQLIYNVQRLDEVDNILLRHDVQQALLKL